MATIKVTAMTADASPTTDDLIMTVNDPGGTPASRKVTLANFITFLSGQALGIPNLSDAGAIVDADLTVVTQSGTAFKVAQSVLATYYGVKFSTVTIALTNKDLTSGTNTFPTLNQNTTGSAAKWTTARNLAGNSVDGSANATFANKFIVQGTTDAGLSAAQFLGALGTGIVKNTTTTGVLSIASAGTDYLSPTGTETVSGKRITRRVTTQTGNAPTWGSDTCDFLLCTAITGAINLSTNYTQGTPNAGDRLEVKLKDDGTGRAITWPTNMAASGTIPLPTTTVASTLLHVFFEWDSTDTKFRCVGIA